MFDQKGYMKKYRQEYKEKIKKRMKEYFEKNKIRILNYHKEYYKKHKNQLNKQHREYNKEHKGEINKKKREVERLLKLWAIKKLGNKCQKCGLSFEFYIYDFHHLNGKDSWSNHDSRIKELKKWKEEDKIPEFIQLLCSNCHRKEQHELRWEI